MTKEEFIKLVNRYGDACEAFGDYNSMDNAVKCTELLEKIIEAFEKKD